MISLPLSRPNRLWTRSPSSPNQLARIPATVVGLLITAGVHSTVWILASSAESTRRARWNSSSSDQVALAALSRSQIALCSLLNTVMSMAMPAQNPVTRDGSFWTCWAGSLGHGREPSALTRSLPSTLLRRAAVISSDSP